MLPSEGAMQVPSASCDKGKAIVPLRLRPALLALARCAVVTARLLVNRKIRQPGDHVGKLIAFGDRTSSRVYRETVRINPNLTDPTVLIVCFRLRHVHAGWMHALFRAESELNTLLFAGFDGFVSKLWVRHDQSGLYRGLYQWDCADLAVDYVRALWWPLALVSEKDSIRYMILPGRYRDDVVLSGNPELSTTDEVSRQLVGAPDDEGPLDRFAARPGSVSV